MAFSATTPGPFPTNFFLFLPILPGGIYKRCLGVRVSGTGSPRCTIYGRANDRNWLNVMRAGLHPGTDVRASIINICVRENASLMASGPMGSPVLTRRHTASSRCCIRLRRLSADRRRLLTLASARAFICVGSTSVGAGAANGSTDTSPAIPAAATRAAHTSIAVLMSVGSEASTERMPSGISIEMFFMFTMFFGLTLQS